LFAKTQIVLSKVRKMWTGFESIRWTFIRYPWLKVGLVALSVVLLLGSGFWLWRAYTKPLEWEETVTLVNYQHQGEFDYQVYMEAGNLFGSATTGFPTVTTEEEEEERPQYFTNLIENIEVSFTYEFVPDYGVSEVYSDVDIVAIIHGPSGWQKEVPLKSSAGDDSCTVSFPLELENFDEIIDDIEDELGIRRLGAENTYDLVIEARVNVSIDTGKEWVTDTFVQPMEVSKGQGTLTWDNELNLTERRYQGELSYKHVGNFDYTIFLAEEETVLYGSGITELGPEPYEPPVIISRPSGDEVYFSVIIDIMKSSFSYRFICDQLVTNLTEEVEVTATLEYPDMWEKTFTLIPKTMESGDFILDFPLDINYFSRLADVIREEIGMGAATHDLTINAEVHTSAYTEFGTIDEVFTQTLKGTLGTTTITWDEELEKSESGTIETTTTVIDRDLPAYRLWSRIVAGVVLFLFLFVGWHAVWARPVVSKMEAEAFRAKRKHKNVIVDITELPAAKPREIVVPVGSLDELIKAADNLLKPVLHKAETDKHIYCVIDGLTRYEYISELKGFR
jgi:hypothetical protein